MTASSICARISGLTFVPSERGRYFASFQFFCAAATAAEAVSCAPARSLCALATPVTAVPTAEAAAPLAVLVTFMSFRVLSDFWAMCNEGEAKLDPRHR